MSVTGNNGLPMQHSVLNALNMEVTSCPTRVGFPKLYSTHYSIEGYGGTYFDMTDLLPKVDKLYKRFDGVLAGGFEDGQQAIDFTNWFAGRSQTMLFFDPHMGVSPNPDPLVKRDVLSHIVEMCRYADIIMPSYMDACLITDVEYRELPDSYTIRLIAEKMAKICPRFVIKGIILSDGTISNLIYDRGMMQSSAHALLSQNFFGSRELWSAIFTGYMLNGKGMIESSGLASSYTVDAIARAIALGKNTVEGPAFEEDMRKYSRRLNY